MTCACAVYIQYTLYSAIADFPTLLSRCARPNLGWELRFDESDESVVFQIKLNSLPSRAAAAITVVFLCVGCGNRSPSAQHQQAGGSTSLSPDASPDASTAPEAEAGPPFEPVAAATYVAKVKNLLLALPPANDEVATVAADPTQFKALVNGWMQQPQYQQKMQRFFELAFQQTQISAADYADQAYPQQIGINTSTIPLLIQNTQESFARTMLALIAAGQPLTAGLTTRQLMLTTALKELYAFLDVWEVDDNGKVTDRFKQANSGLTITVEAAAGPIPITDTLDPTSPNYMHWYDPDVATAGSNVAGCTEDPIVYPVKGLTLHYLLYGALDGRKNSAGTNCPPTGGTASAPQLTAGDFSDWSLVTVRAPAAGETTTHFYDLPALRASSELVLSIPRVGFFSTPAFFANWPTNISNQMRVTLNQTLIVALGAQVDGADGTVTPGSPGLDTVHAAEPSCAVCHQTLDPLRSIFSATYSWNYHNQLDTTLSAQKGMFVFRGVIQPVASMSDFGGVLAGHPLFAAAWAQKLCYYANSSPCYSADPEFQRVVTVFQDSGFSWNTLVAELFSSPLVTNATETQTADANGEVVAVSRRDHLCAALDNRLGLSDVCGLKAVTKKQQQATVAQIASGLPSDGYGRGSTIPVLPNQPTLFYRAAIENICVAVAAEVIDVAAANQTAGVKYWSSSDPQTAISDFVSIVMALPASDPRAAPAAQLLQTHFSTALQQGATATDALKSTFVTACLAPSAVSIGI